MKDDVYLVFILFPDPIRLCAHWQIRSKAIRGRAPTTDNVLICFVKVSDDIKKISLIWCNSRY